MRGFPSRLGLCVAALLLLTAVAVDAKGPPPQVQAIDPGSGPAHGGTQVTITGKHLGEATNVRFDATEVVFEVVGDQIVAMSPPHAAGLVQITVTTPGGSGTIGFEYTGPPPKVDSLSPTQGSTQGGQTVTIKGSALTGATAVRFGSVAAASFQVVADTEIRAVTPAHPAGMVDVQVETQQGTAARSFTFVATAQGPTIDQVAPASGPAAGGTEVVVTGRGLQNVSRVSFGNTDAASWRVDSDARVVAVTPGGAAGTVQLTLHHPGVTTARPFTYESTAQATSQPTQGTTSSPPTSSPTPPPDPVQTSAPADVVESGAQTDGAGACWVLLAPSTPGQRIVVPFPQTCNVEAVVVQVPDAAGLLNVSVRQLEALPSSIPSPGIVHGPGLVFEAVIRDMQGQEVDPEGAVLQVRMPGSWIEQCPPNACATQLFHYDGQDWSTHPMRSVDQGDGFLVMQADVPSFSLFAVGGTPMTIVSDSSGVWLWAWLVGGVAMVGAPAAVGVWRSRAVRPEDPKVGMLLREMSDKEELLQFLNNAAHDLANPLTPIQLQLDVLAHAADTTDPEEQRRALRLVQQNVEQMTMLVGDLRDAAKVRSGRLRLFLSPYELNAVMNEAAAMMELQANQAGVDLQVTPHGRDVPVRIDRGRMLQVTANFLGNAIKFTPKGGTITLAVEVDGAMAHVRVTDTGRGMGPDDRAKLFEPFSQAHGDAEKAKGTGLGLYISKGIVEAHGGTIGCHSDGPGKGSTFWFTLPVDGGQKA